MKKIKQPPLTKSRLKLRNMFLAVLAALSVFVICSPAAFAQDEAAQVIEQLSAQQAAEHAAEAAEQPSEQTPEQATTIPVPEQPAPPPEEDLPAGMEDFPVVRLRSLDKVTARTMTFEATVGNTIKFGPLYIKIQACRKAPPIEQPESAAFLQVWEVTPAYEAQWIFSGWMFASSPGLSSMDHPIYDVWVLDCLEKKGPKDAETKKEEAARGEGEITEDKVPEKPEATMEETAPVDSEAQPED